MLLTDPGDIGGFFLWDPRSAPVRSEEGLIPLSFAGEVPPMVMSERSDFLVALDLWNFCEDRANVGEELFFAADHASQIKEVGVLFWI